MKIVSLESIPVAAGVEALVFKEHEAELKAVLEGRMGIVDPETAFTGRFEGEPIARPARFGVRGKRSRVEEYEGILAYTREQDLVEFLATSFVPAGRLGAILGGSAPDRRKSANALLRDRFKGFRAGKRSPGNSPLDFVIRHFELEELPLHGRRGDRRWYERSHEGLLVAADRAVSYGGRRIPRRALAWVGPMPEPPSVTWFDGAGFGCAEGPRELPAALYRELDERGRVVTRDARQPLPGLPMEAACLVRIPSRGEVEDPAQAAVDPPAPFDRPLYLVDTREPVPLPGGLPVVEDLGIGLAVAARAPDGIYVPGDLSSAKGPLGDAPRWCIASRVAG